MKSTKTVFFEEKIYIDIINIFYDILD